MNMINQYTTNNTRVIKIFTKLITSNRIIFNLFIF